eukprot:2149020-Pleurochrysis_carterae.AAC.1
MAGHRGSGQAARESNHGGLSLCTCHRGVASNSEHTSQPDQWALVRKGQGREPLVPTTYPPKRESKMSLSHCARCALWTLVWIVACVGSGGARVGWAIVHKCGKDQHQLKQISETYRIQAHLQSFCSDMIVLQPNKTRIFSPSSALARLPTLPLHKSAPVGC